MSDVSQDSDGNLTVKEGLSEIKNNKGELFKLYEAGVDENGKSLLVAQKPPEWISPTKLRLSNGKVVSYDPNELCFEVYNNSFKDVFFVNTHYNPQDRSVNPSVIKIVPGQFGFIPHSYYDFYYGFIGNNDGTKVNLIVNYGEMMFKGNKELSVPEKRTKLF